MKAPTVPVDDSRIEPASQPESAAARLDALLAEFNAGVDAIRAEMLERLSEEEVNQTLWSVGPFERMQHLGPKFLQLAADNPGTEVAWKSLRWVVYVRGFRAEVKASAADRMVREFGKEQRLYEDLYGHLHRPGVVDKVGFYEQVVNSPQVPDRVRGLATYCLAVALAGDGEGGSPVRAVSYLDEVMSEYGDLPHPFDADRGSLGDAARRLRFSLMHLQIGAVAPEIVGSDVHGEPFRLSDYRGKVVLLVFCGDWCGPCRSLYAHEKALLEKHANAPFAIVGVNSDGREKLRAVIARENFPFRWFSDGSTSGPISLEWNVELWPTLYLLDEEGTICLKQMGTAETDALDRTIDRLLTKRSAVDHR